MPATLVFSRRDELMHVQHGSCVLHYSVREASDAALQPVPGRCQLLPHRAVHCEHTGPEICTDSQVQTWQNYVCDKSSACKSSKCCNFRLSLPANKARGKHQLPETFVAESADLVTTAAAILHCADRRRRTSSVFTACAAAAGCLGTMCCGGPHHGSW